MKTLSLAQPWASLVVLGVKRLETRPWQTHYRGTLAIHASKNFPRAARILRLQDPWRTALSGGGIDVWDRLPRGVIIGTVDLIDCVRVEDFGELPACEQALGDFGPGQWIWRLANARLVRPATPWRGRLGLFDVPDEVVRI
jgi:activating signal cointegrator 1